MSIIRAPIPPGFNYIINGDFGIWQRYGVSGNFGNYGFDRWVSFEGAGGSPSGGPTQAITGVPSDQNPALPSVRSLYWLQSTAATTSKPWIAQAIPGVETLAGETATLSFYFMNYESTALPLEVSLVQNFAGGAANVTLPPLNFSIPGPSLFNRYVRTFQVPSVAGKAVGNTGALTYALNRSPANDCLILYFRFPLNRQVQIGMGGVKLEKGPIATPFESDRAHQLALCQSFFQTKKISFWGSIVSGNNYPQLVNFNGMRPTASPTVIGANLVTAVGFSSTPNLTTENEAGGIFVTDSRLATLTGVGGWKSSISVSTDIPIPLV